MPNTLRTRVLPALSIAALTLSLVACSNGSPDSADSDCTPAGASSDKVTVTGDVGDSPKVDFPAPLTTTKTERTVITDGEGDAVEDGGSATLDILAFNATTGDAVDALTATDLNFVVGQTAPFLDDAVLCSSAGERVAAVIPPIEGIDQTGQDVGLTATDAVVLVLDISKVAAPVKVLPKANGEDQPLPDGFPDIKVVLDDDGVPTVTLPDGDPPADFQLATIKKGDGAEVTADQTVTVNYQGIVWRTKTVFNDSWASGEPVPFPLANVIPGFQQALTGQTVGSQVIAIIPPDLGYGPQGGQPDAGIEATDTLVFVMDILAAQ